MSFSLRISFLFIFVFNLQAQAQQKGSEEKLPPYQDSINSFTARLKLLDERKQPTIKGDAITNTVTLTQSDLITQPNSKGKPITGVASSQTVSLYDYENGYWLVSYNLKVGYLKASSLNINGVMEDFLYDVRLEDLTEAYGRKVALRILNNQIWEGMTKDMARESLGEPLTFKRMTDAYGIRDRWEYQDQYLVFENNYLIYWGY